MKKLTTEEFINRSKKIHGNTYDYSLVDYQGSHKKVYLICQIHGEFDILPFNHLNNKRGCKKCGLSRTHKKNKVTVAEFIERAKKLKEYKYSNLSFSKLTDKIILKCPKHGEFETSPKNILRGCGCRKCKFEKRRDSKSEFIEKSKDFHNNIYDYTKVVYKTSHDKVEIICSKHGSFWQKPYQHVQGQGCRKCKGFVSKQETEISNFVKNDLKIEAVTSYKNIKNVFEIDVFIPSKKVGIEHSGLYWHSNKFKDNNYHIDKTEKCLRENIKLIQIFGDEWKFKRKICLSRIRNILGLNTKKIFARKTKLFEIEPKLARTFMDNNHLQGFAGGLHFALVDNDEIVSMMTFCKYRKSLGRESKPNCYEMVRFCNKLNTTVVGGASKLLKKFVNLHQPEDIISYADRRWSEGEMYKKIGFNFIKNTKPNYFYTDGIFKRENRFKYRKQELVKMGYNPKKTEKQIMEEMGYYRLYDCGHKLFEYQMEIL